MARLQKEKTSIELENEKLKKELEEVKKLLQQQAVQKNELVKVSEPDEDIIPEIPMHKAIKVMSLFSGGLNLKTSNDGNAQVFRFEYVGQIFPMVYSDLVKVLANQRKFFEQGYCMILDKDVVKAHYLEEHYKKFIDGKIINQFLDYEIDKITELFANTTPVIQQSIVDVIIAKINNNDYVDKNKVTAISDIYGHDIFDIAKQLE
jgi:hypothetical protein